DAWLRDALEVVAGIAAVLAVALHLADAKTAPDEVVQADPARHDVPPDLVRRELDAVLVEQGLDRLGFEERQVAALAAAHGLRLGLEVAVAANPAPGDDLHLVGTVQ